MIEYDDHFFSARDGIRLFFRSWSQTPSKGIVALVHGFAEHSGRYESIANGLCRRGWSVAAFDYRGHGQSGGRRAHVDQFEQYLDDMEAFLDYVGKRNPQTRCILLGHSQGGLIAARSVARSVRQVSGLVLSSPLFETAVKINVLKEWFGRMFSVIMPTLTLKSGLDPHWISRDQAVVDRYEADPLVSHIASVRWYTELLAAQSAVMREAQDIKIPVLVLQAGDDKLVRLEATERFFSNVGSKEKSLKVYAGHYHELFNDIDSQHVVADLMEWLDKLHVKGVS